MRSIRAVIFDFIGTLTNLRRYNLEASEMKLCKAIKNSEFNIDAVSFLQAYRQAYEKYRIVRYQKLVEVTNAVWVSEALNSLGYETTPQDLTIKTAVNIFFQDYLNSLELRPCSYKMLKTLSNHYKTGLISNFTYSPVIYAGLGKLKIDKFFNTILVSESVGWRKPHPKIFNKALEQLEVSAHEAVYVGDSPLEDIKGARTLGIKTVFVSSQFNSLENLLESQQEPDLLAKSICELYRKFQRLVGG